MTDLLASGPPPTAVEPPADRPGGAQRAGRIAVRGLLDIVLPFVVIVAGWQLAVKGTHLDPFTTRGPGDVWTYLRAHGPEADAARHELLSATRVTVRDAFYGLIFGTLAGLVLALVFNRWRTVEQAAMPIAMAFRAVPLVALTPLIVLIFHRGAVATTIIAGIIVFFPTLINVGIALRAVPASSVDLMHAYGASKNTMLRKVQFPTALPALFASIRIAAPLALVGALLAEWLATGQGLGAVMVLSAPASEYDQLWSAAAITTLMGVTLYAIASAVEELVLARFSGESGERRG